jgi:hypothetical protein
MRSTAAAALCPLVLASTGFAANSGATSAGSLPEVVITAPLPGADLFLSEVPANVQRVTADQLDGSRVESVADALNQLVGSVSINDTQANPFQPDVNFRGFTGSPVLGTPQGVSVFVDGVRVNEAFGDAVNWDLIPQAAISSLEVTPGSNPVFGLNTLGGAIVVTTRRGFDAVGTGLELQGGSFGRRVAELHTGGHGERLDYFLAGNLSDDDGWGEHNPSRVRQGFGKLGYRDGVNDVTLALTGANSSLEGNQTLPRSFLSDPLQSYTWPDRQTDAMVFADLNASHRLGARERTGQRADRKRDRTDRSVSPRSRRAAGRADRPIGPRQYADHGCQLRSRHDQLPAVRPGSRVFPRYLVQCAGNARHPAARDQPYGGPLRLGYAGDRRSPVPEPGRALQRFRGHAGGSAGHRAQRP